LALDIGSGSGYIYQAICSDDAFVGDGGIGGVRKLVQLDSSELLLRRDETDAAALEGAHRCDTYRLHADEEGRLPFPAGTFDLVLSSQSMHWVNDLPGLFKEVRVRRTGGRTVLFDDSQKYQRLRHFYACLRMMNREC